MKRRRRVDVGESSSQMKPDPIQILRPLLQFITMSFIDNSITQLHYAPKIIDHNFRVLDQGWGILEVSAEYMLGTFRQI